MFRRAPQAGGNQPGGKAQNSEIGPFPPAPRPLYIGSWTVKAQYPLCVFFRCCVVRLPEAALLLLSPTSAVPCARTVRTATSCTRSPRRALRLLAAAERRVAGPAPSGPGRQTAFAHPTACPCGSSLGLRQPRAPGRPVSGCRWAHLHPLRRPLHGGDLNLRCALRVCRHPLCER